MANQGSGRTAIKTAAGLAAWWGLLCWFAHDRGVGVFAPLDRTWQLLDLHWLHVDPWGCLWRLHAQPPLYNAAIAGILAADLNPTGAVVHALLDSLGLLGGLLTWRLALRFGAGQWSAALAGALLMASPGYWLVAHWLFYDQPVTVSLSILWLATPVAAQGRTAAWITVAASVVALGWLRSLFHPAWAVGVFVLIAWTRPPLPRRTWVVATLTLGLMTLPYAKNFAQFGTANASTWAGMSLLRTAHAASAPEIRRDLAARGQLSQAGVVGPFRDLHAYVAPTKNHHCPDPHPAVCAPHKLQGGPNFNHADYIALSRQMVHDAFAIYGAEPTAWLRAQLGSWLAWLRPVGVYPFLRPARQPIEDVHTAWAQIVLLEVDGAAVVLTFGVFGALTLVGVRLVRSARRDQHGPEFALLAVSAWTVAWVALVGNTLEHGENYRFRAYLDPLLLAVCASAGSQAWRRLACNR